MKYKVSETPLTLKEYGRNIQSMVEYAKTVEDRDKRTRLAHEIVTIMSNLHPHLKEFPDYKQKLWDHLFVISDFELEVDSPYPIPAPEDLVTSRRDDRMEYYSGIPKFRQYGYNVELMIDIAVTMEEGPKKRDFINVIANTMKQFLRNIDRETTPENVIAEHIRELSKGAIQVEGKDLHIIKLAPAKSQQSHHKNHNSGKGRRGKNRKRKH